MLDKTSSIICAFGLASAAPRSPYRHLELCGIALSLLYHMGMPASSLRRRRGTLSCRSISLFCVEILLPPSASPKR
ncbi:MAG: hypothetical protein MSB96_03885, partial [Subdoligranulum sp.]|nr:hypothetical protein [Subdoligranulum sp.]